MGRDYFSSEYIGGQYDRMAQEYNDNRHMFDNTGQLEMLDELVEKGNKVLDAGCGSGIPVAKYFIEKGLNVVGFDLSKEMIALAERNVPGGRFFQADVLAIDLPPADYDLVVSFYCIFHIEKNRQEDVFRKIFMTLKPGACSYFTLACEQYTDKKEFQGTRKFGDHILPYAHFSEPRYREILGNIGFQVVSMENLTIGGETMLWVLVRK
ncbi:MAG: methyltransferase domain-containing protein [Actinobacteria bacterium]|nr:methyltransferase domain-containing protein [Actinomycetota bacterium]